jgi:uncharacterized protein (AIM24 family)
MFCTKCGNQASEEQNFCRRCGARLVHPATAGAAVASAAAAPAATPVTAAAAPPAVHAEGQCDWCGAGVSGAETACPKCGAPLKQAKRVTAGGWSRLPGRKDMAKLQMGNSSCQIEGTFVPAAEMNLAAGDGVYFAHHVLLWKDPQVNITTLPLKGAWKRVIAGLPLIMTQAQGPGHIAFSKDQPGEIIPFALQPGQAVDVREHLLLVASSNVAYDWFQTNVWFHTKEGKDIVHNYPVGAYMDRFTVGSTPGLLLLHAGGNVFTQTLAAGQTLLVKPESLIFKDPAVGMALHFEHPARLTMPWSNWRNRYVWLRLTGPGRVGLQSAFEPLAHAEALAGERQPMTKWSSATETRW